MSEIKVNTSQNVNINFNSASIGNRIVAFIIDIVIKVFYLIFIFLMTDYFQFDYFFDKLDDWSIMAILGIITLPIHLYTLLCESIMQGQTFGKKIMNIKIIKIDGYQASFGDYLMRWIFRLVDVFISSGIVGLVSMISTKYNQRLGGIVSGTAVISLKKQADISHTILQNIGNEYIPCFPQVIALSDNDMRIIKESFERALKLHDNEIIKKLTLKIQEATKIDNQKELSNREFIRTIIKDYNFYTGKES